MCVVCLYLEAHVSEWVCVCGGLKLTAFLLGPLFASFTQITFLVDSAQITGITSALLNLRSLGQNFCSQACKDRAYATEPFAHPCT